MLYQKLEESYKPFNMFITFSDYIEMVNSLAIDTQYYSKDYLHMKIKKITNEYDNLFDSMVNFNCFHIEYSYDCEDEAQISNFPEKKCSICGERIEKHEGYEEYFTLSKKLRDLISEHNKNTLEEIMVNQSATLLDDVRKNYMRLVPFIGAGLSVPLGFPTWRKIISDISECLSDQSKSVVEYYLEHNDYLECFEIIYKDDKNQLYKNIQDIKRRFSEEFNKEIDNSSNISNHKDVVSLKCPMIITTNYDLILEHTGGSIKYETHILSQIEDIVSLNKENSVLHIHGVSSPSKKDTMIVDKTDYDNLYSDNDIRRKLQSILGDKAILFMGYSLDDYYFMEELMDICQANNNYVDYYAIMINTDLSELRKKLKFYDKIKIINLQIENKIIEKRKDGFSKEILRTNNDINDEIVAKISFLLKYIKNELFFS